MTVAALLLLSWPLQAASQAEPNRRGLWLTAGPVWTSTYRDGLVATNLRDFRGADVAVAMHIRPQVSLGIGAAMAKQNGPSDTVTLWTVTGLARYHDRPRTVLGIPRLESSWNVQAGIRFGTATGYSNRIVGPHVGVAMVTEVPIWRGTGLGMRSSTTASLLDGALTFQGGLVIHASIRVGSW